MPTSDLLKELRIDRDAQPRRARGRWLAVAVVTLAVVAAGAWLAWARLAPPVVRTVAARAAVAASGAGSVLDASGYVTARRQATVSAKITGKVTEVLIEEGQRVEEGAVLARLDDTEAQAQLALARAQLAAARSQVAEVRGPARPGRARLRAPAGAAAARELVARAGARRRPRPARHAARPPGQHRRAGPGGAGVGAAWPRCSSTTR